jgi:CDP-6-deoxy-D-xylo-4-hexulose-3-dehydrase
MINEDILNKIKLENAPEEEFRNIIKTLVKLYFEIYKKDNKKKYIPPSGKVLDEKELFNMIDASLDMWLTAGRFNDLFEKEISNFLGVRYALTVNSGSSANLLAITSLTSYKLKDRKLQEGDEVITVAAGFPTTISPIIQNGLVPVFVDIKLGNYNIDENQIENAITEKTKAIFIAHTLGNPFNIEKILEICQKYNLWLIEDNCDALGSRYAGKYTGTFGHISTVSFYPAHHITMGEGGVVLTNDDKLYKIIMSIRDWGRDCWCPPGKDNTCQRRFNWKLGNLPKGYDHKYIYSHLGYNLKITDWQAAIGLAQLEKLPQFIEKRKRNFKLLYEGLKKFEHYIILPEATPNSDPSWFGFPITVRKEAPFKKLDIVKFLEDNKIGTRQLFAGNVLRQPLFTENRIKIRINDTEYLFSNELTEYHYQLLPNTERVMDGTFWIGVWPGITEDEISYILETFEKFFGRY